MARTRPTPEDGDPPASESSDAAQAPAEDPGAAPAPAEDPGAAPAPAEDPGAAPAPAPEAPPAASPTPAETPLPEPTFTVAEGCTVHCLKGAIRAGEPIRAMDLAGGQEALDELVKSDHVVALPKA